MSILTKITKGLSPRAQRAVIYAPEGFGKSTLAGQFPDPLFLDVEGSTSQLDVSRIGPDDLPDLISLERALAAIVKERPCGSLIVDTIDWAEALVVAAMIRDAASDKVTGIEDFGFGKGYTMLRERMAILLSKFDTVIQSGINVVFLAHSKVVKFEPPDGAGPFDRYEMKLSRQVAPLIKEWADMLLFGNWRTQVKERDKKDAGAQYKAVGGRERLMHCNRIAAWDAKNRHGLADTEKWEIATIEKAFRAVGAPWGKAGVSAPVMLVSAPVEQLTEESASPKPVSASAPGKSESTSDAPAAPKETENATAYPSDVPRSADPIAGLEQEENADPELALLIGSQEDLTNAWLIRNGHINQHQTYRSCPAQIRSRILKNWAGFLKVAVASDGKGGVAE